jgi:hypothetical protein
MRASFRPGKMKSQEGHLGVFNVWQAWLQQPSTL